MNSPARRALRRVFTPILCGLSGSTGCLALAGWELGLPRVTTFGPGFPAMTPNTGLALVAGSAGLAASQFCAVPIRGQRWGRLAGGLVALIGLLSLAQQIGGIDLRIDGFFVRGAGAFAPSALRMAPLQAAACALLGTALLLLMARTRPATIWAAHVAALLAALGAFSVFTAYLFRNDSETVSAFLAQNGLPAAAAVLALSIGVLGAQPH
jgi:hypothetical protein